MAAGLYDRAEDMFKQLVDETDFRLARCSNCCRFTSDQRLAVGY